MEVGWVDAGAHERFEKGACALEWAHALILERAGEPVVGSTFLLDRPPGVCEVLGRVVRSWNDVLENGERQRLMRPLVEALIDSAGSEVVEKKRGARLATWLLRKATPMWLEAAGRVEAAKALRSEPELDWDEEPCLRVDSIKHLVRTGS